MNRLKQKISRFSVVFSICLSADPHIRLPAFLYILELAGFPTTCRPHLALHTCARRNSSVSVNRPLCLINNCVKASRSPVSETKVLTRPEVRATQTRTNWKSTDVTSSFRPVWKHAAHANRFSNLVTRHQHSAVCNIIYFRVLLLISSTSATRQLCKLTNYAVH